MFVFDPDLDYEEFEEECEKIRSANYKYLEIFEKDLTASGLSEKTIRRHLANVDFYLNDFLLRYDIHPMEDGTGMIGEYLGDYFIRKCMWSTPATIKSTAASIKKFYKSMAAHGKLEKDAYDDLCETIKEEMEWWQEDCAQFNDPSELSPFWF